MPKGKYERKEVHKEINRVNARKKKTSGLSKYIFKRDNNTCLMCGKRYSPNELELYYLTPNGNKTDKTDHIITLCLKCHRIAYKGSIWGYKKVRQGNSISIIDWWNREDIERMKLCWRQTNTIYPSGQSPQKSWYAKVYGGKKD